MVWTTLAATLVSVFALTATPDPQTPTQRVLGRYGVLSSPDQRIPANAFAIGNRWACEYGYVKVEDACVEIAVPENGVISGYGWRCKDGYRKVDGACVGIEIPRHAHATGGVWFCDPGYRKVDDTCERARIEVPANARPVGWIGWICDNGYRRSRDGCVAIDMPDNAIAIGSAWECALGFRGQGGRCVPMREEETRAILSELRAKLPADRVRTPRELWSLYVIWNRSTERWGGLLHWSSGGNAAESSCRAHRLTNGEVRLECVGELWGRPIRENCYVLLSGDEGRLECNPGAELRSLPGSYSLGWCRVVMEDDSYGRFVCRPPPGGLR